MPAGQTVRTHCVPGLVRECDSARPEGPINFSPIYAPFQFFSPSLSLSLPAHPSLRLPCFFIIYFFILIYFFFAKTLRQATTTQGSNTEEPFIHRNDPRGANQTRRLTLNTQ